MSKKQVENIPHWSWRAERSMNSPKLHDAYIQLLIQFSDREGHSCATDQSKESGVNLERDL